MATLATITALLAAALNGLAGAVSGFLWWRVEPRRAAWVLIRAGQAASIVLAASAGVAYAAGARPDNGLFWLYAVLPVAVGVFAEQFRLLSAQSVLDARDLPDAEAVGRLPDGEQRSVVVAILNRELGVMALAAIVACFLALRALSEVHGL